MTTQNAVHTTNPKRLEAQVFTWVFFFVCMGCVNLGTLLAEAPKRVVIDEMNAEQKKAMIQQLLEEGDQLMQKKDYNLANATYESIFLLDAGHVETSKRIDQLKKKMVKEGVSETQLVTDIYDEEIDVRVKSYLFQAKEQIKKEKWAQARFNLQKALLINPLHQETNTLYKQVNERLKQAAS